MGGALVRLADERYALTGSTVVVARPASSIVICAGAGAICSATSGSRRPVSSSDARIATSRPVRAAREAPRLCRRQGDSPGFHSENVTAGAFAPAQVRRVSVPRSSRSRESSSSWRESWRGSDRRVVRRAARSGGGDVAARRRRRRGPDRRGGRGCVVSRHDRSRVRDRSAERLLSGDAGLVGVPALVYARDYLADAPRSRALVPLSGPLSRLAGRRRRCPRPVDVPGLLGADHADSRRSRSWSAAATPRFATRSSSTSPSPISGASGSG